MVIVTGAFVAQHAQEQIGGEGTLLIEKADRRGQDYVGETGARIMWPP